MRCILPKILTYEKRNTRLSAGDALSFPLSPGVFSNKTQVILEKVIQDYPNHFTNIKGELISGALQTSRYKSTLGELPGSFLQHGNAVTTTGTAGSGWTCTVLHTADFEQARTRFSGEIYGQLSNSIISAAGQDALS